MTALGKLFRTTAAKLALLYFVVFAGLAIFLILYISASTSALVDRQLRAAVDAEIESLTELYQTGGIGQLVETLRLRSRRPSASLYLFTDFQGQTIEGNVADFPLAVLGETGLDPTLVTYRRLDAEGSRQYDALIRVSVMPGGFRLLVGRDVSEREEFRAVTRDSIQVTVAVLLLVGIASFFFVRRTVLRRIDDMTETSERIMAGDLSRRLVVKGSGDEFDRLAIALNHMLGRIEQLMTGLKEVSDNIAHDLKTPLTRLRNRLETTLRDNGKAAEGSDSIAAAIEESDALIATFEALLRIARVEAGAGAALEAADAAAVIRDVAELYEPVVEDAGFALKLEVDDGLSVRADRMLLSQALANLIDNAVKYGVPPPGGGPAEIVVSGRRDGGEIVLSVADRGAGIPAEDRERVTQRFVRLETSRTEPGSGLGLSLVAAVARLHGGVLELADAAPGLVATLRLPAEMGEDGSGDDGGRAGNSG